MRGGTVAILAQGTIIAVRSRRLCLLQAWINCVVGRASTALRRWKQLNRHRPDARLMTDPTHTHAPESETRSEPPNCGGRARGAMWPSSNRRALGAPPPPTSARRSSSHSACVYVLRLLPRLCAAVFVTVPRQ